MREQRIEGTIVNVITVSSHGGAPYLVPYAASKGALVTLTRNTANALLRDRIRVNGLNIGWMNTPGEHATQKRFHDAPDDWLERAALRQPFGRLLEPVTWVYGLLSAFVHGRPAHVDASGVTLETTNGGLWQSNGPIYVPRAFEFWETLFFDSTLLALLLAGLSDQRLASLERPHGIRFEAFLELLMDWHPSPGPPPVSAAIAEYLCPTVSH